MGGVMGFVKFYLALDKYGRKLFDAKEDTMNEQSRYLQLAMMRVKWVKEYSKKNSKDRKSTRTMMMDIDPELAEMFYDEEKRLIRAGQAGKNGRRLASRDTPFSRLAAEIESLK